MLRTSLRRGVLALGVVIGLASAGAWAMPSGGGDCGPRHGQHHPMMGRAMDPAKLDARLDKLKDTLKLTSAQQGAWQRYAGFVREQAKQRREQFDKMREQTPPTRTPERLERMTERMQEHVKSMEATKAETRRFYDSLSESQKESFDKAMPRPRDGKRR